MNKKILILFGLVSFLALFGPISAGSFDITDASYSYVG
jgi:hypothetical protein